MTTIVYTVRCTFADPDVGSEWARWLCKEHLNAVRDAGATAAELARLDGEPTRYEVRYDFASRAHFEAYERDHAPRLRAEGLARFPLERGLAYERTVGEVIPEGDVDRQPALEPWETGP